MVLGHRPIDVVDEQQIGLAGFDARGEDANPQASRGDETHHRAVLGTDQRPLLVRLDGAHETVRNDDRIVQIQGLAVWVAAGGPADFDEFLDFRMTDRKVDGGAAAAQRALADGQGERIHDANERNHARGLAVGANPLADRAKIAPIAADAAAARRQPHVFVPQIDDAFQRVGGLIEKARYGKPTLGSAIAQDRRGRHEPQIADVIVEALGVRAVVGEIAGDAREQVLKAFVGQQVAVAEHGLAEVGQVPVARRIGFDFDTALELDHVQHSLTPALSTGCG